MRRGRHHDKDSGRGLSRISLGLWRIIQHERPVAEREREFRQARLLSLWLRQATDMRREPVVFDTARNEVVNFHNHGDDFFGFAKAQYTPSLSDVVNLEGNFSQTKFEVPYDSTGGTFRTTTNGTGTDS